MKQVTFNYRCVVPDDVAAKIADIMKQTEERIAAVTATSASPSNEQSLPRDVAIVDETYKPTFQPPWIRTASLQMEGADGEWHFTLRDPKANGRGEVFELRADQDVATYVLDVLNTWQPRDMLFHARQQEVEFFEKKATQQQHVLESQARMIKALEEARDTAKRRTRDLCSALSEIEDIAGEAQAMETRL